MRTYCTCVDARMWALQDTHTNTAPTSAPAHRSAEMVQVQAHARSTNKKHPRTHAYTHAPTHIFAHTPLTSTTPQKMAEMVHRSMPVIRSLMSDASADSRPLLRTYARKWFGGEPGSAENQALGAAPAACCAAACGAAWCKGEAR